MLNQVLRFWLKVTQILIQSQQNVLRTTGSFQFAVQRTLCVLQTEHGIAAERMTAAGRGEYIPVASNDTREGRAANRCTRIVVLPKLDEFNKMIEEGLK